MEISNLGLTSFVNLSASSIPVSLPELREITILLDSGLDLSYVMDEAFDISEFFNVSDTFPAESVKATLNVTTPSQSVGCIIYVLAHVLSLLLEETAFAAV